MNGKTAIPFELSGQHFFDMMVSIDILAHIIRGYKIMLTATKGYNTEVPGSYVLTVSLDIFMPQEDKWQTLLIGNQTSFETELVWKMVYQIAARLGLERKEHKFTLFILPGLEETNKPECPPGWKTVWETPDAE